MTLRRPRTVLALALALLVGVLALFAVALLDTRADDRRQAQAAFRDRAQVAAALIESLLAGTQGADRYAESLGGAGPLRRELDRMVSRGRLAFAVVLDERGVPMASSTGIEPDALGEVARGTGPIQRVLDGAPHALSGLHGDTRRVHFVTGFEASGDERRVLVQGVPVGPLSVFLSGYLRGLPGADDGRSFVLDGEARVLGSPVAGQPAGALVEDAALRRQLGRGLREGAYGDQNFVVAPVQRTEWRVVLAEDSSVLYAGSGTLLEWLILAALATAGLAAVALAHRVSRAAEHLRRAYARLEASNAELEHSNTELRRSNGELEQFASIASHDLQEPLRKVQTFGDQLERRFGGEIPGEAKDYLHRMTAAAGRMSTLIEDLLRFSRVTTHARPPRPIDLARVAREVTADLEALLAETHGSVEVESLPTIEADPLQMRQLLQNLIGNALKFHRPGEPPVVRLAEAPAPSGTVTFTVTDNGIGFEDAYAERIFRVFERLHPRDVYAGTGIGLALCRKIVERHGGTITGHGEPAAGARFTVTLPLVQPASRPAGEPAAAPDAERAEPWMEHAHA